MPTPRSRRPRLRVRQLPPRPPVRLQPQPAQPPVTVGHGQRVTTRTRQLRQWYGRVDWAKHTTVFAALVAAVGLAISAWGTVKTAEVANDQLATSREDNAKDHRAQAAHVTGWSEGSIVVMANRSLDPTWAMLNLQDLSREDPEKVSHVILGTIPPCTAVAIPQQVVYGAVSKTKPPPDWEVQSLYFTTSDGSAWVRENSDGGVLREASNKHYGGGKWLIWDKRTKTRALSECGP